MSTQRQSGAVLLLLLTFLVITGITTFLYIGAEKQPSTRVIERSADAMRQARDALIGWAVGHPRVPGMLPWPDRNTDNNYDGNSNCDSSQAPSSANLIGKLPWLGQDSNCLGTLTPLSGLSVNLKDGTGQTLWYAVSPNLVYNYNANSAPVINSETRSKTTGWLTVRDNLGNVLSNRVAFIVFAPGNALAGQNRSVAAPATSQFLDSGPGFSNNDGDAVFIAHNHSSSFNDSLVYVTVDELLYHIETRIGRELKLCLDQYAANINGANNPEPGTYPWPVSLVTQTGNNNGNNGQGNGNGNSGNNNCGNNGGTGGNGNGNGGVGQGKGKGNGNGNNGGNNGGNCNTQQASFGRFDSNINWPTSCIINNATVWPNWQSTAFYQVAPAYQPGGTQVCPTCLQLNNSGNYYSMILLSGDTISGQQRNNANQQSDITNYLENENATPADYKFESGITTTTFNDRVFCIDANTTCK